MRALVLAADAPKDSAVVEAETWQAAPYNSYSGFTHHFGVDNLIRGQTNIATYIFMNTAVLGDAIPNALR